ncbi:MAG: phosphoglucosamine mutase [Candidatus Kapabacteria bacterium]|nr:phosphoglucosamine mutase [Candidatus Kapabacteria bacterium]
MAVIRSISGLRATLGDGLTPELIANYSSAFAKLLPKGKIIVGRDGRPSGKWIEKIVIGSLLSCGREVVSLGVVPTPTVQLFVEKSDAVGGIIITASHNPEQWNGLKFLNKDGVFLDEFENKDLWRILDDKDFLFETSNKFSDVEIEKTAINSHINTILNLNIFKKSNILNILKERKLKIVVDAVNSSGSVAITSLLATLGCEVIPLFCDGTGIFPHTPEPIPENLTELANYVKANNADLGVAVDPDADRLVLIDEFGDPFGEEKTITLATQCVLENPEYFDFVDSPTVVVNLSTTRMVDDIALMYGGRVVRSAVGEINVVKKMKEVGAIIGGEGSGGVILPEAHYGRDSLVGTALILSLIALKDASLRELSKQLPEYTMLKFKKEFQGELSQIIEKIIKEFSDAEIIRQDGIKINLTDGWVQLRASNTEPIVRVISEAVDDEKAKYLANRVLNLI